RGDEVFEVVFALFFQPGMILGTVTAAAGKIVAGLGDVTAHMLDVCGIECMAAPQVQRRFYDGPAMDQRTVFLQNGLRDEVQRRIVPVHGNRLPEYLRESLWPFEQASRTRESTPGQGGRIDRPHPRPARRKPFPLRNRFGMDTGE